MTLEDSNKRQNILCCFFDNNLFALCFRFLSERLEVALQLLDRRGIEAIGFFSNKRNIS